MGVEFGVWKKIKIEIELMGFFKNLFGFNKWENLLDERTLQFIALEFACYLRWVEDTTKSSIMGEELVKRIEMFLVAEKKEGHIKDFNEHDVRIINLQVLTFNIDLIDEVRKKPPAIDENSRWPKLEEYIGLTRTGKQSKNVSYSSFWQNDKNIKHKKN